MSSQYLIKQIEESQKEMQKMIDERKEIVESYAEVFAIQLERE